MVVDVLNAIENICDEIGANYNCTQCNSTFSKKQSLEKHHAKEHDDDACVDKEKKKGKYDCNYCDSSFRRERNLKLHIRDDHEQDGDNDEEEDEEETIEEETVGFDTDVECDPNLMTYKSDQDELTEGEMRKDNEETREEVGVEDINNEETHVNTDTPIQKEDENVEESSLVTYQEECLENNLDAFQEREENDQEMLPEYNDEEEPDETSDKFESMDEDNFTHLETALETQDIDGDAAVDDEEEQEMYTNTLDADVLADIEEQSNMIDTVDEDDSSLQADEDSLVTFNDSFQETINYEHIEQTDEINLDGQETIDTDHLTDEFEHDGSDNLDQSDQVVDMENCEDSLVAESEAIEETEQFEDSPMVESEVNEEETVMEGHSSSLEFVEEEAHDFDESEAANPLEESVGLDGILEGEEIVMADELEQSSVVGDELVEDNSEGIVDTNEEFLLNGEPIVMDDIAFDILANTLEMTMETPEGEEVELPEGQPSEVKPKKEKKSKSKKRKSEESSGEMVTPIDKKIKEEPLDEIELSGLPVFSTTPAPLSVLKAELKQKEVLKNRVYNERPKQESSNNVAKKLICSYCKQIFPSRPDFNDHMAADHPDILAKHNTPAANKTKLQVAPKKKGDIKSVSRSVKITHIPGTAAGKDLKTVKLEKVPVKEEDIIMKSIPKSTRIIFTPVAGDGKTPSRPVRPTTMSTPNVGKGVKITQIGAKDVKVPGKGVKITQLSTKDVKVTNSSKSVKMTPSSSKSVTITASSETSTKIPAKKLLCTYCKSVFLSRPDFNKHILDDHPEISNSNLKVATKIIKKAAFQCNPCRLSFEEKQKYEQHLDVKHGHKCESCNVSFRVKSKLEEHKRTAHSFKCSICNQKFVASDKLTLHMLSHNIKCEQCPEVFKSKMKMLDHKKMKHSHKCDKCNVKFDEKSKLEVHMEKHRFKCDKCTEVFDTKLKVVEHKKVMHSFKCEKCKKSFEEKSTLEEHIKTNHVLKCKVCNTIFDFKNKLDDHIQKEHNFKCTKCDGTFQLEESLVEHEKEKHSSCETCEDEFSWAEPGHSCYYTKNNIRPTKERVQVQNLYFDY